MAMRISKYPPISGVGLDLHCVLPPSVPPPAPPNPAPIPSAPWVATLCNPASALIFGKFTLVSVATEGMGDILMGYDWGMLQPHIPCPPVTATPAIITCTLGSSHKYFLPSYAVQQKPNGGAIAMAGASAGSAVAISTPAFMITLQDCIDVCGTPIGLVAPFGMGFQVPSVRWVGFSWGDLAAGLISMAGDALSAALTSKLGGALFGKLSDEMQMLAGAAFNIAGGAFGSWLNAAMPGGFGGAVAGYMFGAATVLGGPAAVGFAFGRAADAVGGDERSNDWGQTDANGNELPPGVAPPPAAPAAPPPAPPPSSAPPSSSSDGGPPDGGAPDGGTGDSSGGLPPGGVP